VTPEQVQYTPEVHTTPGWKSLLMNNRLLHLAFVWLLTAEATPSMVCAQTNAAPPLSGVIGKVQSVSTGALDIQTPSGVVYVQIVQPATTYRQIPSDLSHVTSSSYVGVASVDQPDGTKLAKQVIIFPESLRGAAEGSVITDPAPGATDHSRMTNGTASRPVVSHSRMTNGTLQKDNGTTLVVHYQDGSQTISVPADVAVTLVAPEKATLGVGDTVYVATEKRPNGDLTTHKILLIIPAAHPNSGD
jgi:hypothetical protein